MTEGGRDFLYETTVELGKTRGTVRALEALLGRIADELAEFQAHMRTAADEVDGVQPQPGRIGYLAARLEDIDDPALRDVVAAVQELDREVSELRSVARDVPLEWLSRISEAIELGRVQAREALQAT